MIIRTLSRKIDSEKIHRKKSAEFIIKSVNAKLECHFWICVMKYDSKTKGHE